MKRVVLVSIISCLACGGENSEVTTRPPLVTATANAKLPPAPPPQTDGRLPQTTKPMRYAIDLAIDPRKDGFAGTEDILVDLAADTAHVVMNAREVTVKRATAKVGDAIVALHASMRPSHGALEPDELVLSADRVLPKGHATITIAFDAPFGKQLSGLYVAKESGESYAFTQFEAADARRAFPCFDEPGFKTPFDVKLTVPQGMVALSNGPEKNKVDHDGATTVTFATTPPLPTYLVAFAVGHFDVVDLAPQTKPPIRFVTTKGHGALSSLTLHAAAEVVPLLAKYFGIVFPYDKLDLVAVPDFDAGGMENAGFITFRDDAVLLDEHASLRQRRSMIGLITHELAHQWFGDLVTMKWWDDLWLNEGFATWTTYKIVDEYKPAFGAKIDAAASATYIMDEDGLASTRAIRQPVSSVGQAMEAFDGITYQKGAAVLRMIEHTVGEDAFQRGVHAYLTDHAWGNATASDLLSAIDAAKARSAPSARDLATSYLDKPGVPVAMIDQVTCDAKTKHATIAAHETRFVPLGAAIDPSASWPVPFCVAPGGNGKSTCTLLQTSVTLDAAGECPFFSNVDAVSYYRTFWPESALGALVHGLSSTTDATRVLVLADAWAQTRAGKLSGAVLLRDVLPAIDRMTERHTVERLVSILYELADVVDDATWPAFSAYVRARLAPHLARVEHPAPANAEDARLLRRTLLLAEVDLGGDEALVKKLAGVAKAFHAGDKSIDSDYGQVAVEIAARTADPATLRKEAEAPLSPEDHALAMRAASGITDPAAVRAALDWMLTPAVKLQDVRRVLWPLAGRHATRATTLAWARDHWEGLRTKLPGALSSGLVGLAGYACTDPSLAESRAFYTQKAATLEGAARPLSEALESASLCVALRDKLLPEIQKQLTASGAVAPARR